MNQQNITTLTKYRIKIKLKKKATFILLKIMYEYIESSLLSKWTPASFHVELPVARKKIVRSIVKANGSSLHDAQESRTERGTAVRFAYTLIQPWSLGLVCKCVAIFRPVSRLYNTFVRSDPLPLDTRGRRCVRAYLVHAQPARADTYTCVRCNCRTRQTGYPRGSSTPTPPGHRLQHQTGPLRVSSGQEHRSSVLRSRSFLLSLPHRHDTGLRAIEPCSMQRLHTHRPVPRIRRAHSDFLDRSTENYEGCKSSDAWCWLLRFSRKLI